MDITVPLPRKLYSAGQIGLAAFLGSPVAAGWFVSRNEQQLGRPQAAARWIWGSAATTVALLVIGYFLPERFPSYPIVICYTIGMQRTAKTLFGKILALHLVDGGTLGSWWVVVGISVLFSLVICAVIISVAFVLPDNVGDPSPNPS